MATPAASSQQTVWMSDRRLVRRGVAALAVLSALLLSGCQPDAPASAPVVPEPSATRAIEVLQVPSTPATTTPMATPNASRPAQSLVAAAVWLRAASGGDGDSWKDLQGREYRLGLVNTPETNECYGSVATRERKQLVANGFRARVYTHDTYGRSVSVVTLRDGANLNVYLARHGYANDKYLAEFRHENPALAA
jgi:endonuclease YncB( thermonuclease family)